MTGCGGGDCTTTATSLIGVQPEDEYALTVSTIGFFHWLSGLPFAIVPKEVCTKEGMEERFDGQ